MTLGMLWELLGQTDNSHPYSPMECMLLRFKNVNYSFWLTGIEAPYIGKTLPWDHLNEDHRHSNYQIYVGGWCRIAVHSVQVAWDAVAYLLHNITEQQLVYIQLEPVDESYEPRLSNIAQSIAQVQVTQRSQ